MSHVTDYPPATANLAVAYYQLKLSLETDCADVHAAMQQGKPDFVLLHVVGSPEAFLKCHIPGAIHLRHADMSRERLATWPMDTLFVVYCAGPHCNGADRAALKLAQLGRPAKLMLGGLTGWQDEGFALA